MNEKYDSDPLDWKNRKYFKIYLTFLALWTIYWGVQIFLNALESLK